MRSKCLCVAAGCILAAIALLPIFSSGTSLSAPGQILYSFTGGSDGANPYSDLTLDSGGNLYGTASAGGHVKNGYCDYGCGTVFELQHSQNAWTETVLYTFQGGTDGYNPVGGVIFDKAGNLYGTTEEQPNECNQGNVFKLSPGANGIWTETVLYSFTCGTGYNPTTDLAFDSKGDLFGTASDTVFELIPQANGTWNEVTLHQFNGGTDGAGPISGVILDSGGNVYGTTLGGGAGNCYRGCGIVYKLTPGPHNNWTETILYNFARGGGAAVNPSGGLILANPHQLLGTTTAGGDGLGTVFELTKSQSILQSVLYRFYGTPDGSMPIGQIISVNGLLFGVTLDGGSRGLGTVFKLLPSEGRSWRETILHSFSDVSGDGSYPEAGLVADSEGHLYGTTSRGGKGCNRGCGIVYEITP
jgi:uncharacterized repeat protein (TIGR03803 family)